MKFERKAKIDGVNMAHLWVDENEKSPIIHIKIKSLYKIYVLYELDNALMMFLIAGQHGRTREIITENTSEFIISNDPEEGRMEMVMYLN